MIVFGSVLLWGIGGFLVPREYMRAYMIIAAVGLCSLYFFFVPPVRYDLYRHYEILHIIRKYDLRTVLFGTIPGHSEVITSIASYQSESPVYLLFAYVISLFRIDQLLPFTSGLITYCSVAGIILMAAEDIGEDVDDWKISLCFCFLVVMLDFRTISGLRNMMTYAVFAYILYRDLVRNANKLLCFGVYLALAGIHSSIFVLIIIRILLELNRFVPLAVLMVCALLTLPSINVILNFAMRFSSIPVIRSMIAKILVYGFGNGTKYDIYRGTIRLAFTLFFLFFYQYCRFNILQTEKFKKYGSFLLVFIMYTLGAIRQYDIFVRGNILMYFMILPFLLLFLHHIVWHTPLEVVIPETSSIGLREVILYIMTFVVMLMSLKLYFDGYYRPMDPGMIQGIKNAFGL